MALALAPLALVVSVATVACPSGVETKGGVDVDVESEDAPAAVVAITAAPPPPPPPAVSGVDDKVVAAVVVGVVSVVNCSLDHFLLFLRNLKVGIGEDPGVWLIGCCQEKDCCCFCPCVCVFLLREGTACLLDNGSERRGWIVD